MRLPVFILFLVLQVQLYAQSAVTDGPYVFNQPHQVLVQMVLNGKALRDSFPLAEKPGHTLYIPFKGGSFPVQLRQSVDAGPSEYKAPEKIFVLSDVEGTFQGTTALMQQSGVIGPDYKWTYGTGHLVICGDLFDRGQDVTAFMWLLYQLEQEARQAGGNVHVIVGNHEIMNLSEDIRYVHPKYMEASTLMNRNYLELYTPETELGRWIRTRNMMEKVGDWLFLHGGISPQVTRAAWPLDEINEKVRSYYDKDGLDSLIKSAGLTVFFDWQTSPLWYRGYFQEPLATSEQVDSTLHLYKVKHIVVGHTIVDSIITLYGGRVVAIDVNRHAGNQQALLIEDRRFYRVYADGRKVEIR